MPRIKQETKPQWETGTAPLKQKKKSKHSKSSATIAASSTIRTAISLKKTKKSKVPAATSASVKKPHRYRPGTVALRKIKNLQKSIKLVACKIPFQRMVREAISGEKPNMRIRPGALLLWQHAVEDHMHEFLTRLVRVAINSKRVTPMVRDAHLLMYCQGTLTENS